MFRLYLDSSDNDANINTHPGDTTWVLGEVIPPSITSVSIFLDSCSIPITIPTFRSGVNNILDFYENSGAVLRQAVISPGTYSGLELATELQTQMNAVGSNTYTVTYSSITKKLSINTTIPDTFRILSSSTCLGKTGFQASLVFVSGQVGDYMVFLLGSRYLDVCVNFNCTSIALNRRNNIIARIPLSAEAGSVIFWASQIPIKSVCSVADLTEINIRLFDDTGSSYLIDPNHQVTYNFAMEPLD